MTLDTFGQEAWDSATTGFGADPIWVPDGYQLLTTTPDVYTSPELKANGDHVWIKPARWLVAETFQNYLRRPYTPSLRCASDSASTDSLYFWDGVRFHANPGIAIDPGTENAFRPTLTDWMPVSEWIDAWASAGSVVMVSWGAAGACNWTQADGSLAFGWVLFAAMPQDFRAFNGATNSYVVALPGSQRSTYNVWASLADPWLAPSGQGPASPDLAPPTQQPAPAPTPIPAASDGGSSGLVVGSLLVVGGLLGLAWFAAKR